MRAHLVSGALPPTVDPPTAAALPLYGSTDFAALVGIECTSLTQDFPTRSPQRNTGECENDADDTNTSDALLMMLLVEIFLPGPLLLTILVCSFVDSK